MNRIPHPSRRSFLATTAALAACGPKSSGGPDRPDDGTTRDTAVADTGTPKPSSPPNIVMFYADQHRGDVIGAWNDKALTPNIDRLAAEGVSFPNTFTNAPACRPARVSMMQRRHVTQTGIWDNKAVPPEDMATHVQRVRDQAGYYTMVIGKTHLYDSDKATNHTENMAKLVVFGFTDSIEIVGPTDTAKTRTWYTDWLMESTPPGEESKYDRYVAYTEAYVWGAPGPDTDPYFLMSEDHQDIFIGVEAAEWVRAYQEPQPFYLQVNFPGPHSPFDSTTEYRDLFDMNDMPLPILVRPDEATMSGLVSQVLAMKDYPWTEETALQAVRDYYAKVAMVDAAVGMVLDALEERGMLENTLIIYHADHGEMLADHFLTGKVIFYEGAVRVPLIIRPPGGTVGWTSVGLHDTLDVVATIEDAAKVGPPEGVLPGRSLLSKVGLGPDDAGAQVGQSEVLSSNMADTMVRTDRHKIVYNRLTDTITDVYDLAEDPKELVNLVSDPAMQSVKDDLLARLVAVDDVWPPLWTGYGTDYGGS